MALDNGILIGFLIEIGRWAKSELNERWRLSREGQEIELTDKSDNEFVMSDQVQSILSERGEGEVKSFISLIERKREAVYRTRNAKLADREQLDRGEITQAMFEERIKKHNSAIQDMMEEIAEDLKDIGFKVERVSTQ